jgi:hypothetical protein
LSPHENRIELGLFTLYMELKATIVFEIHKKVIVELVKAI